MNSFGGHEAKLAEHSGAEQAEKAGVEQISGTPTPKTPA